MKNWELARYLIDAKKCVDSVYFIAKNVKSLHNLTLKDIVEDRQRKFYINVKVVYDKCFTKTELKNLKGKDRIFTETCNERDKNYAHKDEDYVIPDYKSIVAIADLLKKRLNHCFDICKEKLPEVLTLDFIEYDRNLYRFINKIDYKLEEELMKKQHPGYKSNFDSEMFKTGITKKVFNDTEEIRNINDTSDYAVIFNCGLTLREEIQEMQDSCIKFNVLFGKNMWMKPDMAKFKELKEMIKKHPDELPFLY